MTGQPVQTADDRAARVIIRRAGRSDIHAIGELWQRAGLPPSRRGFRNEIARLRRRDPELLLIALLLGELVGAIAGSYDGRTAVVSRLAVAHSARRSGVGTALVEALCGQLDDLGAGADRLIVLDDGDMAASFWTALGFHRGESASSYVREP